MNLIDPAPVPDPATPQTHALVIGVGEYPHLLGGALIEDEPAAVLRGLGQLTSPVVSAGTLALWLAKHAKRFIRPLGSVELLLSPGTATVPDGVPAGVEPATFENIKAAFNEWVDRCDRNVDNRALFFFCGHGIQAEVILLLPQDFGADKNAPWDTAIDFSTTFTGMNDCKARAQCYFLDACRERPIEALKAVGGARGRPLKTTQQLRFTPRDAPVLLSAPQGWQAQGPRNEKSHFTEALIRSLEGLGASRKVGNDWIVRTNSLGEAVKEVMKRSRTGYCTNEGASQFSTDLLALPGPALVLADVLCEPPEAHAVAELFLARQTVRRIRDRLGDDPWELEVEAGVWDVGATFPAGTAYAPIAPQPEIAHPPLFSPRVKVIQ
jgi:hypothetical protein